MAFRGPKGRGVKQVSIEATKARAVAVLCPEGQCLTRGNGLLPREIRSIRVPRSMLRTNYAASFATLWGDKLDGANPGNQSVLICGSTTFPGFMRLSGSSARLIARMTSTAGPCSASRYFIFP